MKWGPGIAAVVAPTKPLGGYLNDHLTGSVVALGLIGKLRSSNDGTALGAFLDELEVDVQADRGSLEQAMGSLGVSRGTIRQAGGWMLEKASRIKFDKHVTGSQHLSRLMELEALSLGIEGKLRGWRALKELSNQHIDLDLDALMQRASDQGARLEPFRVEAARRAFVD
jgi:hypothetical protein